MPSRFASITAGLVAGLLAVAATPSRAQESDFFEQMSNYFKTETIEGVSKHAEAPTETPATVTIVSREDIERYGFRTVADVLNFASLGNFVNSDRRYDLAGDRGLFFFEDFNTRILVMLNGHSVNEPWANFAGIGRSMLVPLDLVDRIEIIYGPSSLLYGGYSLYGIVNVITKNGVSLPGSRVRVTGGSWGTGEVVASYGAAGTTGTWDAPGTEWNLMAAAGYYRTRGENLDPDRRDVGYPVSLDGGTIWGGPESGNDFERAPFLFFYGKRGDLSFMARAGYRKRGAPLAPYGAIYGRTDQTLRDEKSFGELRWDHSLGGGANLSVRVFHDIYRYAEQDPYADSTSYPGQPGYYFHLETSDHDSGGEVRFSLKKGTHFLTVGGEYRYRSLGRVSSNDFFGGGLAPGSAIRQDATGRFGVIYLQEEWRPLDKLSLVAGGNFADTTPGGSKAQPRVAVIFKPRPSVSIKGLYGRGFRPPSIFEASYADFQSQIDNPALRSEEIESLEASLIWNPGPRVSLQAYGFHSRLTGLIQGVTIVSADQIQGGVTGPSGDPADLLGELQYQSTGDVRSRGAGLSVRYRGSRARGYLNLAYARAELAQPGSPDLRLPGSSAWLGSGGLSLDSGDWTASICARYMGPQPLDPSRAGATEAGDFFEANARVLYRTRILYPVTFSLDLRNLFDAAGGPAASPVFAIPVIPLEGRQVAIGAEVRF